MPWFKVDDKLHDHRKARRARKAAMGVWVLAGSWCMDHLTDGFVPETVLIRWGNRRDAAQLVTSFLWETAEKDGEKGWQFCNWESFQPSKAEVESEREATRKRVKEWRDKRRGNAVTPTVTNDVVTREVQPPRPDPTRPDHIKEPSARKRATALPDEFTPNDRHHAIATEQRVNLVAELEKFRDYSASVGWVKKDWDATFRNWLRNARPSLTSVPESNSTDGAKRLPDGSLDYEYYRNQPRAKPQRP